MAATPLVSVCMATYQHEKYVSEAVRSVLNQSFTEFELVIVNDGSTDGTAARIAEFADPRIVVINQRNQGPAAATNAAIAAARGKYIALFSGDDVCHPDRLKVQLEACRQRQRRVLFSGVEFIDDNSIPLSGDHFAASSFHGDQLTRDQILARLFHHGNFLNGVTTFAERAVFAHAPYDPTLLQLQDFELWVRLIKDCDIQVIPDKCVSYRIRRGGGNLSAPVADAIIRSSNEHYLILRRFFDDVPMSLFQEAFSDSLIRSEFAGAIEYQCEQAFLYVRSKIPMARAIGIERLHALLNDASGAAVLAQLYQFTPVQFFELLRTTDTFNVLGGYVSTIYWDTGAGWVAGQEVRTLIHAVAGEFALRFELPPIPGLKALRWDPIEGRACRIRIASIEYVDANEETHFVADDALASNGFCSSPGTIEFETNDPSVWWTVDEGVKRVAVRGHWEFDHLPETLASHRGQIDELKAALDMAQATAMNRTLRFAKRVVARLKAA
jgi:glycosyltransferase involved in cell wall biosynthesis